MFGKANTAPQNERMDHLLGIRSIKNAPAPLKQRGRGFFALKWSPETIFGVLFYMPEPITIMMAMTNTIISKMVGARTMCHGQSVIYPTAEAGGLTLLQAVPR